MLGKDRQGEGENCVTKGKKGGLMNTLVRVFGVCVCVCVREREKERDSEGGRGWGV